MTEQKEKNLQIKDPDTCLNQLIRDRRSLHRIPETGMKEHQTNAYLRERLTALGYEPEAVAGTGLCVYIPGNDGGIRPGRALRCDMDALAIEEPENKDFVSTHPGIMHACGHDGHMSMVLGVAEYLKAHPDFEHGPVLLVFQPAEEGPGGAEPIVESGVFEHYGIDEIYGFHLFPFLEEGKVATTAGPMMAMTSEFYITIRGKSAHAGEPENGIDAILAGAAFVQGVQSILTRNINRNETTLLNIGTFAGGERMNIVPGEVKLSGTLRSYKNETQKYMQKRMREVLAGVDLSYETTSELIFDDMYPPVRNDHRLVRELSRAIDDLDTSFEKVMLAEDFSMYQKALPGVFIGLGVRNEAEGFDQDLHTPGFNFNERVLLKGLETYLKILGMKENV